MTVPDADRTHASRLGAAALLMTFAVFLSRIVGYLREAFVAAEFGAGGATDAFFAAFTIPDWLNHLVAGGTLSITFLPIYARYLTQGDEAAANRALSVVTTFVVAVVGAGVVLGVVFAEPLTRWFFGRMEPAAVAECARLTRILLPAQLCFVAGGLLSATLLARGHFRAAAFAPLLYNAGIIGGGWLLGDTLGIASLAWGALAGAFVGPFLVPAIAAVRAGARVTPRLGGSGGALGEWLKLSLPLMIGVSLITADDWILRWFAGADAGAISHLTYAKRLVAVPIAVAGQAVGQASMPFFARLFAEGRRGELAETIHTTLRAAGVVGVLAGAGMIALGEPLVTLLFQRGAYDAADSAATAVYLAIFAAAVPLWVLQGLVARAFYAAHNTWTPMLAGTAVTLVLLPVYALGWRWGGPAGLAVASSAGILLHTLVIAALLPRLLPEVKAGAARLLGALARAILLGGLAGAAAWGAAQGLAGTGAFLQCAAGGAAFGVIALAGAGPLGVRELSDLMKKVAKRFQRRG